MRDTFVESAREELFHVIPFLEPVFTIFLVCFDCCLQSQLHTHTHTHKKGRKIDINDVLKRDVQP